MGHSDADQVSVPGDLPCPTASSITSLDEPTPGVVTNGTTGQAPALRPRNGDPRHALGLSDRDLAVVRFLATVPFAAQYQIHEQFFADTSDVPVSRCVRRLHRFGLVALHRWNGTGVNLAHSTDAGRGVALQHCGIGEEEVFIGRFPSASALPHSLWIVDVLLAARRVWKTYDIYPCWRVRRILAGTKSPVPDLLVASPTRRRIIAIEVDLATENLKKVLLPKLQILRSDLPTWGPPDAATGIIILTSGERRLAAIAGQVPVHPIPIITALLPDAAGRRTIGALTTLLTGL